MVSLVAGFQSRLILKASVGLGVVFFFTIKVALTYVRGVMLGEERFALT
jgi:hypothetical protein